VMVSETDLARAAAFLDGSDASSLGPVSDDELAAQAEAATGYTDPTTGAVV
jgi:hypothetical protein